jgi:hypothetical protein
MRLAGLVLLAGILALPASAQQPPPAENQEKAKKTEPAAEPEKPRPVPQLQRREPKPLDWNDVAILTGKSRRAEEAQRRRAANPYVYLSVPLGDLDGLDDAALFSRTGVFPARLASRSFGLRGRNLLGLPLLGGAGRRGTVIVVR